MAYIELKNVTYTYPLTKEPALKNISFSFERGKFYGIIGENAGGKTTLCNLLRGLIPHFYKGKLEGDVLIDGEDIRTLDMDALSTQMGYIFQNPFTQISGVKKTVFEEIAMGMENLGVPKEQMIKKVFEIAELLKIEDLLQNDPNALSGGQRQKVAFASIIAMDTDTFVIDEPTSQLDPDGTAAIEPLTVVSVAGSSAGASSVYVNPAKEGSDKYFYKTGAAPLAYPSYGEVISQTEWNGSSEISGLTAGNQIMIIETDSDGKALKAGVATITVGAD